MKGKKKETKIFLGPLQLGQQTEHRTPVTGWAETGQVGVWGHTWYSLCEFCNNIGFYGRNINRDPKLQKNGHLFLLL